MQRSRNVNMETPRFSLVQTQVLQRLQELQHPRTDPKNESFNKETRRPLVMMTRENKSMCKSRRHCSAHITAIYLNGMTQFLHFRRCFCVTLVTLLENPHSITPDK